MKKKPVVYAPCPRCGTPLLASLAARVADPTQEETCPKENHND